MSAQADAYRALAAELAAAEEGNDFMRNLALSEAALAVANSMDIVGTAGPGAMPAGAGLLTALLMMDVLELKAGAGRSPEAVMASAAELESMCRETDDRRLMQTTRIPEGPKRAALLEMIESRRTGSQ